MRAALLVTAFTIVPQIGIGQDRPLAWDLMKNFRYNIHGLLWDNPARKVTIIFSVTNPQASNSPYDILTAPEFKATPPQSATLRIDIGWNTTGWGTTELVNTGFSAATGGGENLLSIIRTWMNSSPPGPGGVGPAFANVINALTSANRCSTLGSPCSGIANPALRYYVSTVLPKQAEGSVRAAIEGHPVVQTGIDSAGQPLFANVPVQSESSDLSLDSATAPRRTIVDIAKCKACHDGNQHGATVVPRLSLHGGNRTEKLELCAICHNPNQTDAAYRSSGPEESVDFKRLVHGIHAGGMRKTPLIIVGFRGAVNDFRGVRFPAKLRNCLNCHIDIGGRGTFELPLASTLGSSINTGSLLNPLPGTIDVDPQNDLKISPIAAACSACHDDRETRQHMTRMGASFGVPQSVLTGREQCVQCHGRGREKDVRRVHEIRTSRGDDD